MTKYVLINNKLTPIKEAKISINERGFLFGDGIFETCRIDNGFIYNFTAHLDRLNLGLKSLKFNAPIDALKKQAYRLIKQNQIKNGILRISISRGIGSKGYAPTYKSKPLIIIQTKNKPAKKQHPITLAIGSKPKPSQQSLPIFCKTSQSLPYILNKIEAEEKGVFDCVMINEKGFISETSAANIFWVKDGQIFTPSKKCDILLGTIRQKIIDNFQVKQVEATIDELEKADEIFLTNVSDLILRIDEFSSRKSFRDDVNSYILTFLKNDIKSNPQL